MRSVAATPRVQVVTKGELLDRLQDFYDKHPGLEERVSSGRLHPFDEELLREIKGIEFLLAAQVDE